MVKTCKSCGYIFDGTTQDGRAVKACRLSLQEIQENYSCSDWCSVLNNCCCCQKPIPMRGSLAIKSKKTGEYDLICQQCNNIIGKCNTCEQAKFCEFETNSSPIPKAVVKTIRQGNSVIQTQVINPDRINATCKLDCTCWNDTEQMCMKAFSEGCQSYNSTIIMK